MAYRLEWDPRELPYLGHWATNGGYLGERNAAWEPSDGYYDSVETARANGALPVLGPGAVKTLNFKMTWRPLEAPEAEPATRPAHAGRPR